MNVIELWGHKARVIVELDIGEGRTVNVPVTEDCRYSPGHGSGELTIYLRDHKLDTALDEAAYRSLDRP